MRHFRSILYALVLAPAVWILCGVGFDQDLTGRARDNGGLESLTGMFLLLLAGAAYAILLFAPISPAGPLLAGVAFLGAGSWARFAPEPYAALWPANVAKQGFDLSTPGYGLVVLLAVPMICTALSARRWAGYEPPQILLLGTIGRVSGAARVAGPPMASERTTVLPGAYPGRRSAPEATQVVPEVRRTAPEATQIVRHAEPTVAIPLSGDENTTVVPIGRSDTAAPAHRPGGVPGAAGSETAVPLSRPETRGTVAPVARPEEKTALVPVAQPDEETTFLAVGGSADGGSADGGSADEATVVSGDDGDEKAMVLQLGPPAAAEIPTEALALADAPTREVVDAEAATREVAAAGEITRDVVSGEPATEDLSGERATADLAGEPVTLATVAAPGDGDEKTQVLRLPAAASGAGHGEATQVIRAASPAPGEATTAAVPAGEGNVTTKPMSIVGAERPDPGADPTARLGVPAAEPTRAPQERRAVTASHLERPADEAADDTRPLSLPAQRQPADDDATRRLH